MAKPLKATVTKTMDEHETEASMFECSECNEEFVYGPDDFPTFCPCCGAEFNKTEDKTI